MNYFGVDSRHHSEQPRQFRLINPKRRGNCAAIKISLFQKRRKKCTLDKAEVTTLTVLLPLRNNQFVICQLADYRFDGSTKFCRRAQTSVTVGNLVAPRIFRMRAHKNGHLLSLGSDLRLETFITWIGFYGEPISYERELDFRRRYLNDMLGARERRPKRFCSGSFFGKALQPQIHRLYCTG